MSGLPCAQSTTYAAFHCWSARGGCGAWPLPPNPFEQSLTCGVIETGKENPNFPVKYQSDTTGLFCGIRQNRHPDAADRDS